MDTVKDVIDTPTRMMDTIFGDVSEGTKVRELSALAKRVELPSFNISLDEKNQYNKKVPIMTGLKYDPINISFYDDNNNTTINLINNYYKYFFGDGNVPKSAAFRPDVVKQERNFNSWGLQARAMKDFFLAIDVYSFNRGTFTMHSMKSPYIMSIKMGDHEYGSYEPRDINIQIGYSSIVYASGYIKRGTPPGFADLIYDFNPSPLTGKYPTNLYDALGESASALGGLFGGTSNIQSFITPIQQFSVGGVNTNMPSTIPLVPGNILSAFNTGQSGMRTSTPNGQPVSIGGMQGSGQVVGGGLPGPATPTAGSISVTSLPTLK
jgi:hypothetical protein